MSKNNIVIINRKQIEGTIYYQSILDNIVSSDTLLFSNGFKDNVFFEYFGNVAKETVKKRLYDKYKAKIENIYFDLSTGLTKFITISISDINSNKQYLSIGYNDRRGYELRSDYLETESQLSAKRINEEIEQRVINQIKDKDCVEINNEISSLINDDGYYLFGLAKVASSFLMEYLSLNLKKILNYSSEQTLKIKAISICLEDFNKPLLSEIYFKGEKDTVYDVLNDSFSSSEEIEIESLDTYLDIFLEKVASDYIKKYEGEYKENLRKEKISVIKEYLEREYKKYEISITLDNISFLSISPEPFIFFKEDNLEIYSSRNQKENEIIFISYSEVADNLTLLNKYIDNYLETKTEEYNSLVEDINIYLDLPLDPVDGLKEGETLLKRVGELPEYDLNKQELSELIERLEYRIREIENIDKDKVSEVLTLIEKIIDNDTYDEYSEDLFDLIDELSDSEKEAIEAKYEYFLNKFKDLSDYKNKSTALRRVYIKRTVKKDIKELDKRSDLHLSRITDEIVEQLKTLPGDRLGKYLLTKGLNFPIKGDRSIKKIRIANHSPYRLLFVYNSDLGLDVTDNSIKIFAITKHEKDKKDLYRKAKGKPKDFDNSDYEEYNIDNERINIEDSKPKEYEINGYEIYKEKEAEVEASKIPEVTPDQKIIANNFANHPTVTFGCAGSGKTTVSIEQYANIVYNHYNYISPKENKLVYITFHLGLANRVRNDLLEFKVTGNCYSLSYYYAKVLGEIDKISNFLKEKKEEDKNRYKTIANEITISEWFNKEYSNKEISKNINKKKKLITPLLKSDKKDLDRLVYMYYRGVYKGSLEILDSKNDRLDLASFMSLTKKETSLDEKERESIYYLCVEYDDYLKNNNYITDNDLALAVIKRSQYGIEQTECIIVDETQDLTEIEIYALLKTLKNNHNRAYFYGDPHQSINPNIFTDETIKNVYRKFKNNKDVAKEVTFSHLAVSYRTNHLLIDYLNKLIHLRKDYIASTGEIVEIKKPDNIKIEESETSWASIIPNKDILSKFFTDQAYLMIITPDDKTKQEFINKYGFHQRVSTIYEAKGMEWDLVIMYSMFTTYEPYFIDMISKNGKSKESTIHRMTFNKYYVGCTRSRKDFLIFEENENIIDDESMIYQALLNTFDVINDENIAYNYVSRVSTFEDWYSAALQNLYNDDLHAFENAYHHAQELATPEQLKILAQLKSNDPEIFKALGFKYLDQKKYYDAGGAFRTYFKKTKKLGEYWSLCLLLSGIDKKDTVVDVMRHRELIDKYPEVIPIIIKHKEFKRRLLNAYNLLTKEK